MLEIREVHDIVKNAAAETLKGVEIHEVHGEPTTDSVGDDALQIHIVAGAGTDVRLLSNQALEFIYFVQQALLQAGEERFPIIAFATEDDKTADDDAEP